MDKRSLAIGIAVLLTAPVALSQNVGKCGWGSKLFDGQAGIAPQVLAVTTNGTSGNQTFAITSGTSGCTQDGIVRSAWKTAAYIDGNMNKLARDMSRGTGESLDTLAALLSVDESHRARFGEVLQQNYSAIFTSPEVASADVTASLRGVLEADEVLSVYSVML